MANTPRILNMRPDPPDLRDRLYNPILRALEPEFNARPFDHPAWSARVKDQGKTSACTGFALAAMVESLAFKCWEGANSRASSPALSRRLCSITSPAVTTNCAAATRKTARRRAAR